MTNNNFSQVTAFIWSVTDLLRGDFKQSQYGRVILPFTLLRRLECVLIPSKDDVLKASKTVNPALPKEAQEEFILKATRGLFFYNTSEFSLSNLSRYHTHDDLYRYLASFSENIREIFEHFNFYEFIRLLDSTNLLFSVVDKMSSIDLSDQFISNVEMGEVFEELIRRFAESSNETAGEHFTPRDIVRLTTGLVLGKNDVALSKKGIIRTVYDPTVGTGGFLSSCSEYLYEYNPEAVIKVYGQEINPESYAICKAYMLIKGQDVRNIKLGNSLSNDQFSYDKFDYMLSNPPFGMDWKKIEYDIKSEHTEMGFNGRFGAGLPRVSDSSLLFLMHLISKMRDANGNDQGSRIGIILNGSPLFTGSAGSGESEIRRYILEADLLEAIIALPTNMFYNTGIATYVWVLSNNKEVKRKGKVHLINATNLSSKMRKTLGSKRNYLTDEEIRTITQNYGAFEALENSPMSPFNKRELNNNDGESDQQKPFSSKIFNNYEFGYRRVTIERPLRLSAQMSDERIASLRFASKPFNALMQKLFDDYGNTWTADSYGELSEYAAEIRALIKAEFSELKEKDIKTVLEPKFWLEQRTLLAKVQALQAKISTVQFDDFNVFDEVLKQALTDANVKLKTKEKKQFIDAITWKNPDAEPVVSKVVKGIENPLYGQFSYKGKVVEFAQDADLRDAENIALDPNVSNTDLIESYFKREVGPHVPDAWINADKRDDKDGEIGTVGYLIDFHRKFIKDEQLIIENRDILRIKNLINTDKNGEFVLNRYSGEIVLFSDIEDKSYSSNLTRFTVDSSILNYQYYNTFLSLPEGKDWLDSSLNTTSIIKNINFNNWINLKLDIPEMKKQLEIVDFFKECEVVLEQINLLKNSTLNSFEESKYQIKPYLEAAERYENEFSTMLPTPLAILWELAESRFNDRDRCEAFTKFYEFLGMYLLSILFGKHNPKKNLFYSKRTKNMESLTMGFSHKHMNNEIESNPEFAEQEILSYFLNYDVIKLLRDATSLRNDIAHRGLPSANAVNNSMVSVKKFNEIIQNILRDFFSNTTLISPIQSKYDGQKFTYEVDILKGFGVNPSKSKLIKTSSPLISNQLYLITGDTDDYENISVIEIFPILIWDESINQSEIKAFYFYSDSMKDEKKLRYVCPYPNMETYKFKEWEVISGKCRDNDT